MRVRYASFIPSSYRMATFWKREEKRLQKKKSSTKKVLMRDLSITTWRLLSCGRSRQRPHRLARRQSRCAGAGASSAARNNRPASPTIGRVGPDAEGRPRAATIGEKPLLKAGVQLARATRHRNAGVSRVSLVARRNLHLFLAGEGEGRRLGRRGGRV